MSDTLGVLYVALDRNRCTESAKALKDTADDIETWGATTTEGVETALAEAPVDCVVFGEDPLNSGDLNLVEVAELCSAVSSPRAEAIPLVLFTGADHGPSTARTTEGVTDYARADAPDAVEHLDDRVRWAIERGDSRHETLVESMEEAVLVVNGNGRVQSANRSTPDRVGLPAPEIAGVRLDALADRGVLDPDDADALVTAIQTVIGGDGSESVSVEVNREGSTTTLDARVTGLPGEPTALVTLRDAGSEDEPLELEAGTPTKVDRLRDAITELGTAGSEDELFERVASEALRVFDADAARVESSETGEFVPLAAAGEEYDTPPADSDPGYRALSTGDPVVGSEPGTPSGESGGSSLCLPVGDDRLVRVVSRSVTFGGRDRHAGGVLAAAVGQAVDRLRTEMDLRETESELREAETDRKAPHERLDTLLAVVPDPVVRYASADGEPVIEAVNPAFEATFGVEADRVRGDPLHDHVRPPTDDPGDVAASDDLDDARDLAAALVSEGDLETVVRRETDDGPREFLVRSDRLPTDAGGYVVYGKITHPEDVSGIPGAGHPEDAGTDPGSAARDSNGSSDPADTPGSERSAGATGEATRSDAATGPPTDPGEADTGRSDRADRHASTVAEELDDRLNEARAYFRIAEQSDDVSDFEQVRDAHDRIDRLIDDLVAVLRGDPAADPAPVGLEDVARDAWNEVETRDADLLVEDAALVADREGMTELVRQLVRNAIDHADDPLIEEMGSTESLIVRVGPLDDGEGFYVEDTGDGIPPEARDRIFDPGYSTGDGTGLGLALVERIAEAHDWTVEVEESPEGGARFEVVAAETERQPAGTEQRH